MEILNRPLLETFSRRQPLARRSLNRWVAAVEAAQWNTLVEVKESFKSVDYVKGSYIFNIHGNAYRLLTTISFTTKTVRIIDLLTHAKYSKLKQ